MRIRRILPVLVAFYIVFVVLIGVGALLLYPLEFTVGLLVAFGGALLVDFVFVYVFYRFISLQPKQHLLVRREGRLIDTGLEGGTAIILRLFDRPVIVGLNLRDLKIEGVRCLTQDAGPITIGCSVLWQVASPIDFAAASGDCERLIETIVTFGLQSLVGTMSIRDYISTRAGASATLLNNLRRDPVLKSWGVRITGFWITAQDIPEPVQNVLLRQLLAGLMGPVVTLEGTNAARALTQMKAIVGNDAMLLEILKTLNETFGRNQK